jgi:hypothetical protein
MEREKKKRERKREREVCEVVAKDFHLLSLSLCLFLDFYWLEKGETERDFERDFERER